MRFQAGRSLTFISASIIAQAVISSAHPHTDIVIRLPSNSCFYPSGNISLAQPCNSDAETSTCCKQGWICLTNGLCQATIRARENLSTQFSTAACTDKDWDNPSCSQICRGPEDSTNSDHGVVVCNASKNTYCCQREYDCCQNSSAVFSLPASIAIREITDPSPGPRRTRDPGRFAAERRKVSLIIGIAVGLGIALIIVLATWGIWFCRRRTRKQKRLEEQQQQQQQSKPGSSELDAVNTSGSGNKPASGGAQIAAVELETSDSKVTRGELEGSTVSPEHMSRSGRLLSPNGDASTRVNIVTPDIIELDGKFPPRLAIDGDQRQVKDGDGQSSMIACDVVDAPMPATAEEQDEEQREMMHAGKSSADP